MNIPIPFIIFSLLGLFYAILSFYISSRVKTTNDYFLAGRSIGLLPLTFTFIATQLGGGMLLGTSQEAYTVGIYGILYTLGISFGFLLLGLGIAARLQLMNVATTAEIFETHYHSKLLKQTASAISILTLCGLLIAQVVASRTIIAGLGSTHELLFIGFWAFIIVHTMIGGLKGIVFTDTVQVLFIICVFVSIFLYSIWSQPNIITHFYEIVELQNFLGFVKLTSSEVIATISMPALFALIEQDLAQRFFAARTTKIAMGAALAASMFMIFFALVPIYFGMLAKLLNLSFAPGTSPLIPLITALTNKFMLILALCGLLAAITSTADSLLCAISSNVAQDFDFSWLGVHNPLRRSQITTCIIGVFGLVASYFVPQEIIPILVKSYEFSVSCLLVPLLFAYFNQHLNKSAAYGAIIFGCIAFFATFFINTTLPLSLFPVLCSLLGYWVGSKISLESGA